VLSDPFTRGISRWISRVQGTRAALLEESNYVRQYKDESLLYPLKYSDRQIVLFLRVGDGVFVSVWVISESYLRPIRRNVLTTGIVTITATGCTAAKSK
jgi:hypothetical protein